MDITCYRRRNLARIIKERYGKGAEFARAYEMPAPNVSQLVNGPRAFGPEMARRIEEKEGLRLGWMDEEIPFTDKALMLARRFMELDELNQALMLTRLEEITLIEKARNSGATPVTQTERKQIA
jgi:hypothetical protein